MAGEHATAHILQSLFANLAIALAKGVAAVFTGSGALLAETLHTLADCGNQLLLLLGVKKASRPPDATHPLGYGRDLYFWSFMVAQLLFTGGGVFSIYEGVHKIGRPERVDRVWLGFVILGFSLVLEGWSLAGNVRELDARRGAVRFFRYLQTSKDSDLVVVFGENFAAVIGLGLAMAALALAAATGDGRWDAVGSLAIGVVLIGVSIFLAREVKSLLVGESADPAVTATALRLVDEDPRLETLLEHLSIQQGPGEVLLALKIRFQSTLNADQVSDAINELEKRLRVAHPQIKWIFVEPDTVEGPLGS